MKNTELNSICLDIYEANKLKGFDVSKENVGQTLMLVNSELCEALEAHRKGKTANLTLFLSEHNGKWERPSHDAFSFQSTIKDSFEDELADAFIRLMDLVGALKIDIDTHIELKREFNTTREYKHGKAY